jgi:hypothetical protein
MSPKASSEGASIHIILSQIFASHLNWQFKMV